MSTLREPREATVVPGEPRLDPSVEVWPRPPQVAGWVDRAADADDLASREAECRRFLELLRWPGGIVCPRCSSGRIAPVKARHQYDCRACRYRFSVTSGTLFHDSNVPLWKWFVAVSLTIESEKGLSAHALMRAIGVSYKTAWFLGHRIRAALYRDGLTSDGDESASSGAGNGHPGVSAKYLHAYVAEREWRSRNRTNPDVFAETVLALLSGKPLSAAGLIRR